MNRDNLTPAQRAIVAAEGARFAAASRSAETSAEDKKPVAASVKREVQQPVKAAAMTLIAIGHLEIIGGHVFAHGTEIMPGLAPKDAIERLIDQGSVREYDSRNRRSLYRIFSKFSGCEEHEPLDEELTPYALPS
jgi:hypothetical protein